MYVPWTLQGLAIGRARFLFFVRRHRAYAPMVLPCMRADAVLMLLPTISSNSLDSARSDSTASAHFVRSVSTANSQQRSVQ